MFLIFKTTPWKSALSTEPNVIAGYLHVCKVANLYWIDGHDFGFGGEGLESLLATELGAPPCTNVICLTVLASAAVMLSVKNVESLNVRIAPFAPGAPGTPATALGKG